MSCKFHMKQPKHLVEIKLNRILASKPHLINHLNRNISHPLIGENFHKPFLNFNNFSKPCKITNITDYDNTTDYDNITDFNIFKKIVQTLKILLI